MKGIITSLCLFATLSLVSCDETARLAKELPGSWAGTPENISDNSLVTASIIETLDINADNSVVAKGSRGGVITIAGMLSVTTQVVSDEPDLVEPLSLTAAAKSLISGTWTVIDDDEVVLVLDLSTLNVDVDPSSLVVTNNLVTATPNPKVESLKASVLNTIGESMKRALYNRYTSIRRLDDVKVKGPLLKFEIGKTDCVFTRQGDAQ
ncbi:MAG: hypothetical protein NC212_08900 [Staphylococcus sp.]|nr:hypothetical protein [Staphylococcus sp.]